MPGGYWDKVDQPREEPKRISVQLTLALKARLVAKAKAQSRSVSALVARYIRDALDADEGRL